VGYESLTISSDTLLQWPINGTTTNVVANIIEVTATTTGLKLYMPPATQVSDGQSALIRNIGPSEAVNAGAQWIFSRLTQRPGDLRDFGRYAKYKYGKPNSNYPKDIPL
jgi:hypothetical protein